MNGQEGLLPGKTDRQHKGQEKGTMLLTGNSSLAVFLEAKKESKTYQQTSPTEM